MSETASQFSQRVMPHSHKLFAVAMRFLHRPEEAEDIVQDLFVKLWERREELPPGDELLPFMLTMVRNLCIDRLRHLEVKGETESSIEMLAQPPGEAFVEENSIEDRDRLRHLIRLMADLPPLQQQVLRLRAFQQLETDQIARLLHLSNENVRQLLSRARRQLKTNANRQDIL